MSNNNGPGNHSVCFSSVQAFALPVETWFLVYEDCSKSELKVTLCILLNYFQVGIEAEPLSFSDILKQTKLSKSSVAAGLDAALFRKSIIRTSLGGQIRYEPRFEKIRTHDMNITPNTQSAQTSITENTCHGSEIEPRRKIFGRLLEFGLAYHVAQNIAMTNRYPLEQLQDQLRYIDHELERGNVPKNKSAFPGYVVNRIKYNVMAPLDLPDKLDELWMR